MQTVKTHKVILKARKCGLEVFRLMVWENGKLVLVSTHMGQAGAETRFKLYEHARDVREAL